MPITDNINVEMSRDGGTTWVPATLEINSITDDAEVKIMKATCEFDIHSPAGNSLIWRLKSTNGTATILHGVRTRVN